MTAGVSIDGDIAAGQFYVPRATHMLQALKQRAELTGVTVLRDFAVLSDYAYCYAIVAGSVAKVIIVVDTPPAVGNATSPKSVVPDVPDFYSGVVIGGAIPTPGPDRPYRLTNFWPTSACATLFDIDHALRATTKLGVFPHGVFGGILSNQSGGEPYSQYVKLKPTMYSGTMRKVVQLMMGFGRQLGRLSLYDQKPPRAYDPRRLAQPTRYQEEVSQHGLQIRYDWRFYRTHGIVRGQDGTLWLVEVSAQRGVIAMPLPMHPNSMTDVFADKLAELNDTAGLLAVVELGGFPTGEMLPFDEIDSWVRAGVLLRLVSVEDMDAFYSKSPYSSAMGWAFRDDGSEAHNTCWKMEDDGVQTGYHYALKLRIEELDEVPDPPSGAESLKRFLNGKQGHPKYSALIAKIDRLSDMQVTVLMSNAIYGQDAMILALDALTADPIAVGEGTLQLVGHGRLYHPGIYQPHIKFPEPDIGYLVSHSMDCELGATPPRRCDTVVHVFFAQDDLKWVRFFRDDASEPAGPSESDEEDCMYEGQWTFARDIGVKAIPPMVYTNDIDDREKLPAGAITRTTKGVDLGYTSVKFADDILDPYLCTVRRTKTFLITTTTITEGGRFVRSAVTVPFGDRCAYYYARALGGSRTEVFSAIFQHLEDPYSYSGWRNLIGFTGFATTGCTQQPPPKRCWRREQHPDGCGPVEVRTVASPAPTYRPYPCSDNADNGEWLSLCQDIEAAAYQLTLPPLPPGYAIPTPAQVVIQLTLVNDTTHSPLRVSEITKAPDAYEKPWFQPSPDPESGQIQRDLETTHNALGDGTTMRYMELPDDPDPAVVIGAPQIDAMIASTVTFVGVV